MAHRKYPLYKKLLLITGLALGIGAAAFLHAKPSSSNNKRNRADGDFMVQPSQFQQTTETENLESLQEAYTEALPKETSHQLVVEEDNANEMKTLTLLKGSYVFAPCRELPDLRNTESAEVVTYIANLDEIVYDPSTVETVSFREGSSVPGAATIPVGAMVEFDFGKYKQEVIISENSEYHVSADQSLELQIKKNFFTWSPFNPAMQIGFCNMDTMKCYVYETLPGTHLECYQETYNFSDLPEGNYRFCIRNLYPRPLEVGYIRFGVYIK